MPKKDELKMTVSVYCTAYFHPALLVGNTQPTTLTYSIHTSNYVQRSEHKHTGKCTYTCLHFFMHKSGQRSLMPSSHMSAQHLQPCEKQVLLSEAFKIPFFCFCACLSYLLPSLLPCFHLFIKICTFVLT